MSKIEPLHDAEFSKVTRPRGRPTSNPAKIADMKAKIASQARELFLTEGYHGVSMRRIAAKLNCSAMSLYSYYPAKIDILRDLWAELFHRLFEDLAQVVAQFPNPSARLRAVSFRYVSYWLQNPEHYRMVFMSATVSQTEVSVFVDEDATAQRYALFYTLVNDATCVDAEETRTLSDALVCALQGVAHCLITISSYPWTSAEHLVTALVDGILGSGTRT